LGQTQTYDVRLDKKLRKAKNEQQTQNLEPNQNNTIFSCNLLSVYGDGL